MDFDNAEGRCLECDGHYTHASDCSRFERASALSVEMRVAIYANVRPFNPR